MGFRNPATSATAVDTGPSPTAAGVRLYERTFAGISQGVAEWRTGAMDTNATIALTGGGSGGSSFAVSGGATEGVNAPELDLNVEQLAAGGYGGVARMRNAGRLDLGSAILSGSKGEAVAVQPWNASWSNWGGGLEPLNAQRLPGNLIRVAGVMKLTGAYGAGVGVAVLTDSSTFPSSQEYGLAYFSGGSQGAGIAVHTNGWVVIDAISGTAPASGTGFHFCVLYLAA